MTNIRLNGSRLAFKDVAISPYALALFLALAFSGEADEY